MQPDMFQLHAFGSWVRMAALEYTEWTGRDPRLANFAKRRASEPGEAGYGVDGKFLRYPIPTVTSSKQDSPSNELMQKRC